MSSSIWRERIRRGGYAKGYELARLPPEEVMNAYSAKYEKGVDRYRAKYAAIKDKLDEAPFHVRGLIWNAAYRLLKLVEDKKTSDARAEYGSYRALLMEDNAAQYLDEVLIALGIYERIVNKGGGDKVKSV